LEVGDNGTFMAWVMAGRCKWTIRTSDYVP